MVRDIAFICVLLVAAGLVCFGVAMWLLPLAFILGGAFVAVIGWLALSEPDAAESEA